MASRVRATLGLALSTVILAACDGIFGIHVLDYGVSGGGDDGPAAGDDETGSVANPPSDAGTDGGRAGPRMAGGDDSSGGSSGGGSVVPPNDEPDAATQGVGATASRDGDVDAYVTDDAAPGNDANDDNPAVGNASDGAEADAQGAEEATVDIADATGAANTASANDSASTPDTATTYVDAGNADAGPDPATTTPDSATTSADASVDQQAPPADAADDGSAPDDSPSADAPCEGSSCGGTCVTPGGTNLLTNGGFDTGVAAWTVFDPNIVLTESSLDATGCASSGSVLATNQAPNGLNSGFYQCVPLTAGVAYNAGVMIRTPSGGAKGQTFLTVTWFPTSDCTGSGLTLAGQVESSGNFDAWESLTMTNLVAPAGTQSGYVYGQIIKNLPNTLPYQTYFDMFYLSPAPGGF